MWSRHYLTRIVPMEIPTGARPPSSSVCSQRTLKGSLRMLHVAFGPKNQCCPRGSPNTMDRMSLTKVRRKVQHSQVFSRILPFEPRSALPAASRFLDTQMRISMLVWSNTLMIAGGDLGHQLSFKIHLLEYPILPSRFFRHVFRHVFFPSRFSSQKSRVAISREPRVVNEKKNEK